MLPSPRTSDTNGAGHHGDGGMDLRTAVAEIPLLPTPAAKEPGGTPEQYHQRLRDHDGRESSFLPLSMAVQLLPTPTRRDFKDTEVRREPHRPDDIDTLARALSDVLLPTPRATDGTKGGPNQRGSSGDLMLPSAVSSLLPTPTAKDSAQSGGSTLGDVTLTDAVVRTDLGKQDDPRHADNLLPTPRASHWAKTSDGARERYGSSDSMADVVEKAEWGEYEPAIRRWEDITRPAPEPTKPNAKGNPKLSDEFDEWLMGLPKGWITDVPGITWNEVLKACGNGVVPQQAVAGIVELRAMARWAA